MSFGPTARCSFCGGVYYLQKLAVHESICSSRPKRLTVGKAVRLAIESHPEASRNRALLVRLVWQIMDGYRTEPPRGRLTDPRSIVRALLPRSHMKREERTGLERPVAPRYYKTPASPSCNPSATKKPRRFRTSRTGSA